MALSLAGGNLMNLPSDILLEILTRLPTIDIINCKPVCKNWMKILSSREFVMLHISRSNHCLVAIKFKFGDDDNRQNLLSYLFPDRQDLLFQIKSKSESFFRIFKFGDDDDPQNFYHDPVIEFDLSVFPNTPNGLVGSVDGLVCFDRVHMNPHRIEEILYVSNPLTREYVTLPIVTSFYKDRVGVVYGFGVSAISSQYKVVAIRHRLVATEDVFNRLKDFECRVYTLGTGSWRTIGGVNVMNATYYSQGLFFNGNLHWLIHNFEASDIEGSEFISCFDLDNESFRPFPSPLANEEPSLHCFSLGIVMGCLCLCDNTPNDIVIWVMKEYEVKKSWTKDFVIRGSTNPYYDIYDDRTTTAIKIFKDGDILLSTKEYLLTYSNDSKTLQRTRNISYDSNEVVLHVSSFLSLKDFEPEKVRTF